MPELPEVEITLRGIRPHVLTQNIEAIVVREARLRWPVDPIMREILPGHRVENIARRAKYLLLYTEPGAIIVHLGMSGSLHLVEARAKPEKHDHVDIVLGNGYSLRLRDPRRFGAVLWTERDPLQHARLAKLGPEPWDPEFTGDYLYRLSRCRHTAVKSLIMDSRIVVGIGNIYANEALYYAGIRPARAARRVSLPRYQVLAGAIREVLGSAIEQGGTTLRNFTGSDGRPGYFKQQLAVYGRTDHPCVNCGAPIRQIRIGQRSSFFCASCQS